MSKLNFVRTACAAMVLGCVALPATASSFTVDYQEAGKAFGTPNLSEKVYISSPYFENFVNAGPFRVTSSELGDFIAWCVDLADYMTSGESYMHAPDLFSSAVTDALGRLFTSHYDTIDTAREGAAMQLAIWEIITDGDSGKLDLMNGDFKSYDLDGPAAAAAAQDLLDSMGTDKDGYRLTFIKSDDSQDLLTVTPVPLPAAALMLLAGLGGLAGLRRRRGRA